MCAQAVIVSGCACIYVLTTVCTVVDKVQPSLQMKTCMMQSTVCMAAREGNAIRTGMNPQAR